MAVMQAKVQGAVTGFILGIKGNMKAIGVIAFSCAVIYIGVKQWCLQHGEARNTEQIQQVWQHSTNWVHKSDLTNAVEQIKNGDNQ